MSLLRNLVKYTTSMMLISGLVSAELTGETMDSQATFRSTGEFSKMKYDLPESLKSATPTTSIKEIYDLSKKGEYAKRPKLGGMDGGGGKVLICPTKSGFKTTVLDLFEAKASGFQIDMGPGRTLNEKIQFVLTRLENVAPFHAQAYAIWISDFLNKESAFYEDSILPSTEDTGLTILPRNCELVQVVVQRNEEETVIPRMARYLVDKDAFLQLDIDSQVALIFHEMIYREARARGEKTSLRSRYLTALVLSKNIETLSVSEFNDTMTKLGSKCTEVEGLVVKSCSELPANFQLQTLNIRNFVITGDLLVTNYDGSDIYFQARNSIDVTEAYRYFMNSSIVKSAIFSPRIGSSKMEIRFDGATFIVSGLVNMKISHGNAKLEGLCFISYFPIKPDLLLCESVKITHANGKTEYYDTNIMRGRHGKILKFTDLQVNLNNDGTIKATLNDN